MRPSRFRQLRRSVKSALRLVVVLFVAVESAVAQEIRIVASFDGLGHGFVGPQGSSTQRNPSDNSLAVGPDHIMQTINTRVAIFTKRGKRFNETGRVLYGPVPSSNVFRGFGGACEQINNGDVVVRYDQLAERWLFVMPIFRRVRPRTAPPGPREAVLYQPTLADSVNTPRAGATPPPPQPPADSGAYAMCYAVSKTSDPMGAWYRYEFTRPLFPDYPRPAVWPDGWYTPTSTGDEVIEKHVCVADRTRMLRGQDATEQCVIVKDVNFLNTSDLDGRRTPPRGAPNIVVAAGGTQLRGVLRSDELQVWRMYVDWRDPSRTRLVGPERIAVAPYEYLCGGQLTECVPQPGVTRRLDSQGDKIMARLVYRRFKSHEALVAVHSWRPRRAGAGCAGTSCGWAAIAGCRCTSRARMRPTRVSAGWPARRSTGWGISGWVFVRRAGGFPGAAVCGADAGGGAWPAGPRGGGVGGRGGQPDQHAQMGGLHADGGGPVG